MSNANLPERASLEYLKKLAKDRLQEMRRANPRTKLAAAQLAVARDYGFSSWRALKAELEQQHRQFATHFFEACAKGDVEALRRLLANGARHQRLFYEARDVKIVLALFRLPFFAENRAVDLCQPGLGHSAIADQLA